MKYFHKKPIHFLLSLLPDDSQSGGDHLLLPVHTHSLHGQGARGHRLSACITNVRKYSGGHGRHDWLVGPTESQLLVPHSSFL